MWGEMFYKRLWDKSKVFCKQLDITELYATFPQTLKKLKKDKKLYSNP
jgi:hypothetical protein